MANVMAHDGVLPALLPVCLEMSRTHTDLTANLVAICEMSSCKRRDAVMEAGWATAPGSEEPNRDLAKSCASAVELRGS